MSVSTSADLPLDETQATWSLLAGRLDALLQAWESGQTPRLADFVPDVAPPLRRLLLSELVKVDLDQRVRRRLPARLEDYLAEFPALAEGGVPCDLIHEEFRLRQRSGEAVAPDDYFRRFPGQAEKLARLLGVTAPFRTTAMHHAEAARPLQPGETLDDFDLLTLLGSGAFAQVFLARQRSMQRLVALKVSSDQGTEAQTLAQLDHPHVVRVYDVRVLPERGLRLLYMKYLAGGTLGGVLAHARKLPPAGRHGRAYLAAVDAVLEARGESPPAGSPLRAQLAVMSWPAVVCWVGARLAHALDYAHRQGVLHRDIKPANVLLTAEGSPCLADFNVGTCTKLEGAGPASLFGGSLAYMSPEQLEAFDPAHGRDPATVDGRSDVYSLAVTLWEMLAEERPFGNEALAGDWSKTLAALTERRRSGVPPDADLALPAARPDGLAEVLRTALEPDPARRFATAGEMAVALELCRHPHLTPPAHGWRAWVRRHPILALLPLGALPNALASVFNIFYNDQSIITPWGRDRNGAPETFKPLITAINGVFFPLCLALFVWGVWPVVRALRPRHAEDRPSPDEAARARARCLSAGKIAAYVCVAGWAVAGVLWPISLDVAASRLGKSMLQPADHVHLLFSLVLCGLVAAAYPFFLVNFLAVRVLYPALLLAGPPGESDLAALDRAERALGRFLVVAAAVPLGSIVVLTAFRQDPGQLALGLFSGAGLAGFALAYAVERRTRADLASLAHIVAPGGSAGEPAPSRS